MNSVAGDVSASEEIVRRNDVALWCATRLVADARDRAALVHLYAVHIELGRVATSVTSPLAGEIRLAWWRDEVEAMASGRRTPEHPALRGLAPIGSRVADALQTMIEGRHAELDAESFARFDDLLDYLDRVDGGIVAAAFIALDPQNRDDLPGIGRVLGWRRLLREHGAWRSRGRDWAQQAWAKSLQSVGGEANDPVRFVQQAEREAYIQARTEVSRLPVALFPVVAGIAIPPPGRRGGGAHGLEIRLRLIWASLTGRV